MNKPRHVYYLFAAFILSISMALLFVNGCSSKKEKVLAKVDEEIITVPDFNNRISKLPNQYQDMVKKEKARFLDDLIMETIFYNEAIRRGIDKQKDTKEVLKEAKKKILTAKLIEDEIEKKIKVDEAEVKDYYQNHKDGFMIPTKYRASHILVKTEEKAAEILASLSNGSDFAKLAESESIDITNRRGGDVGYFTEGQLIPEFEKACTKLEVGQVSPIVKTPFGYHIIKLTDKKEARVKDFEEVKGKIKEEIKGLKRKERFNKLVKDLKKKAYIKINLELIKDE